MSRGCRDSRWPHLFFRAAWRSQLSLGFRRKKETGSRQSNPGGPLRARSGGAFQARATVSPGGATRIRPACLHDPDTLHSSASAKPSIGKGSSPLPFGLSLSVAKPTEGLPLFFSSGVSPEVKCSPSTGSGRTGFRRWARSRQNETYRTKLAEERI